MIKCSRKGTSTIGKHLLVKHGIVLSKKERELSEAEEPPSESAPSKKEEIPVRKQKPAKAKTNSSLISSIEALKRLYNHISFTRELAESDE